MSFMGALDDALQLSPGNKAREETPPSACAPGRAPLQLSPGNKAREEASHTLRRSAVPCFN